MKTERRNKFMKVVIGIIIVAVVIIGAIIVKKNK
jgi:heme/copper-type cytochrome/quinol oxidase subunit 4